MRVFSSFSFPVSNTALHPIYVLGSLQVIRGLEKRRAVHMRHMREVAIETDDEDTFNFEQKTDESKSNSSLGSQSSLGSAHSSSTSSLRSPRPSRGRSHSDSLKRFITTSQSFRLKEEGDNLLCIRRGSVLRAIVKSVGFLNVEVPDIDGLGDNRDLEVCKYHEYVAASRLQLAWRVFKKIDGWQEHKLRFENQFLIQ